MNDVGKRVLDSLREDGVGVVPFAELFDEATWAEVRADAEGFIAETEAAVRELGGDLTQKKFMMRRFWSKKQERNHVFSLQDPWLRAFASPTLLDIVNTYRGEQTKLYYLDNWFTVPFADSTERLASQRWHRDPEDEHVVKDRKSVV